jgi:biopolymer transport protein TolQ
MNYNILLIFTLLASLLFAEPALAAAGGDDVWDMMIKAGLVVQGVLLILVIFSLVSWGVIISKFKVLRDARNQNRDFEEFFWHATSLSQARQQTNHLMASPLASLFRTGYGELGKVMRLGGEDGGSLPPGVMENLRRSLTRAHAAELTRLGRTVTFLATTANTAPFIGLFGTVWGIMDSFRSIGAAKVANLATVAPGIAEALVATATGLFAAIPAVVFYNQFNRRIQVIEAEMEAFTQDFLNLVERDLMRRHGPAVEAVRPADLGTRG